MYRNLLPLVCLALLPGCMAPRPFGNPELFNDADALKAEVLKSIPVGTGVDRAKQVMTDNGFHCQYMQGEKRLKCEMSTQALMSANTMQVDLLFDEARRVTTIRVFRFHDGT